MIHADEVADASDTVIFSWDFRSRKVCVLAGSHKRLGISTPGNFYSPDWWLDRIHPDDQQRIRCLINDVGPSQGTVECAYRIRRDDGTWLEVLDRSILKWKNGKLKQIIGVTADVALLVATQEELERERLLAVAASEAKSRFLANMSHELRTPLGAIVSSVALASNSSVRPPERKRYLGLISKNSHHMLSLIDDLLDLAKVESGYLSIEREPVNLETLFDQVAEDFTTPAAEKGITLDVVARDESCPDVPPVTIQTDAKRLRQILSNLIGNAIKFTDNGWVRITAYSCPERNSVEVRVTDTGIGIAADDTARLFQPFEQLTQGNRRFAGTGLGLSLSRNLARLLGGELTLEHSTKNIGSTFLLRLPIEAQNTLTRPVAITALNNWSKRFRPIGPQKSAPEAASHNERPAAPKQLRQRKVILVDDAEDNRTLLARILELSGAVVKTAADGRAALDVIANVCKEEDPTGIKPVVFMDIEMPVMDGRDALSEIRRREYPVKVVALTAHAMAEHRELYIDAGFDGYLSKPVDQAALVNEVLRLQLH